MTFQLESGGKALENFYLSLPPVGVEENRLLFPCSLLNDQLGHLGLIWLSQVGVTR